MISDIKINNLLRVKNRKQFQIGLSGIGFQGFQAAGVPYWDILRKVYCHLQYQLGLLLPAVLVSYDLLTESIIYPVARIN